jgi:hypothetical protein
MCVCIKSFSKRLKKEGPGKVQTYFNGGVRTSVGVYEERRRSRNEILYLLSLLPAGYETK